jgi:hypothetical protein
MLHYLSSVYFVNQPLRVSGIFVADHQVVYSIYTTIGTCCAFQLTVCWPGWDVPNPDDWRNRLRTNSASSWFLLHRCIEMHGQQKIKLTKCRVRLCPNVNAVAHFQPKLLKYKVKTQNFFKCVFVFFSNFFRFCEICRIRHGKYRG